MFIHFNDEISSGFPQADFNNDLSLLAKDPRSYEFAALTSDFEFSGSIFFEHTVFCQI